MDTQPKWIVWSITAIGGAVGFLTAGLPAINAALNYFFHFTIEPDMISQLGEGLKAALGGLGAVASIVMVLYGRYRATQPVTLLPPSGSTSAKVIIFLAIVAPGVLLIGCTDSQVQTVQTLALQGCKAIPAAADVSAAFANAAAASPVPGAFIIGAAPMAQSFCEQYVAKMHVTALASTSCAAVLNGVCVHTVSKIGD